MIEFLIQFLQESNWLDFKFAELNACIELCGLNPQDLYDTTLSNEEKKNTIYLHIRFPSVEIAREVCHRSVLIKGLYLTWAYDDSLRKLVEKVENLPSSFTSSLYNDSFLSWCIDIDTHARVLTMEEKQVYRAQFACVRFAGPVNLKNADIQMNLLMDFSTRHQRKEIEFEKDPVDIFCYFGQLVAVNHMRDDLKKYSLKSRLYLGPTSLDTSLCFLLANMGHVKKGSFVMDPFVGTASILVAAAHYRALCFGADIDVRVLKGDMYAGHSRHEKGDQTKRDVWENFKSYDLPRPELIRLDNHIMESHLSLTPLLSSSENSRGKSTCSTGHNNFVDCEIFDCFLTDPPYSIRAGARKSGKKGGFKHQVEDHQRLEHIPSTQPYEVEEVMLDLLHNAALYLKQDGRLLYLIPTPYNFNIQDLPVHPCFTIVDMCLQGLSSRHGRHLVILKKYRRYEKKLVTEFEEYREKVRLKTDGGFSGLIEKLTLALSVEGEKDESVIKILSRRKKNIDRVKKAEVRKEIDEKGLDSSLFDIAKTTICIATFMKDQADSNQDYKGTSWEAILRWYSKSYGDEITGNDKNSSVSQLEFVNNVITRMIRHEKALIEIMDGQEVGTASTQCNGEIDPSKILIFNSEYRIKDRLIKDPSSRGKKKQKKNKMSKQQM